MRKYIPFVIAVVAVTIVLAIYFDTDSLWHNQYDDSYITYRYAVNLAEHGQLVFNLGERTDAASSFLYTVVLAVVYRLGWHDMEMGSFLLNMLAVGLIAAFVYLCALRLSKNQWGAAMLGLIVATHGFISGWAVLGMDTVPFTALLCGLVWAIIEHKNRLSLVLVIAVVLMRVEGLLVVPFWWLTSGRKVHDGVLITVIVSVYYCLRFAYYGTILPHSYLVKNILIYYHSNPINILNTWKTVGAIVPFFAIAGVCSNRRIWWLGAYIVIAGASCLMGPKSDWCRYTIPLFPLCLIAGASLFRRWEYVFIVSAILIIQESDSIKWMHSQVKQLALPQQIRAEAGEWLDKNIDRSGPVISGDIGAIAYFAPHIRFIDINGVTSIDVYNAYKVDGNINSILQRKKPKYICDTFDYKDKMVTYTRSNGASVKNGNPSNIYPFRIVWGKMITQTLAILITEIK